MNIQHKWITIPLIILALIGCKEDKKGVEQETAATQIEKKIVFDEVMMINHLRSFQEIALNHNGNRAAGTQGGQATAQYILGQIEKAGFKKTIQPLSLSENTSGKNIIVEIPGQLSDSIILIGAHYDSVERGPGINDNASGVAVVLELMKQLSQTQIRPKHTIHLAFWDAEEKGLTGSTEYVNQLSEAQMKAIQVYINLDMVGTQFPTATIADADKSSLSALENKLRAEGKSEEQIQSQLDAARLAPSHSGDLALEKSLKEFYKAQKIAIYEDTTIVSMTDAGSFAGKVPVAALELLNQNNGYQDQYIPCYHKACDTIDLIDPQSLTLTGNALLHLLKHLKTL